MALLKVEGVSKRFGGLLAVDNVSLHVDNKEIVSIIGPNGAGKTTLFNIITGIYKLNEGKIQFLDCDITNMSSRAIVREGISRTFQNIRLFSNLRVIENVLIGMHMSLDYSFGNLLLRTRRYRRSEQEATQKAIEILEIIGLEHYIDGYASDLPYGKQRRLEIARAIATGARLILLDEPAAGMNPEESEELMQFIMGLRDRGFTILMIEHDMNIVMNISDRVYVMDYGKIIANGVPEEVAANPDVIKAYLGEGEE